MAYFDYCYQHIGQIKTVCLESKHQILVVKTSPYPRIYPTFGFDVATRCPIRQDASQLTTIWYNITRIL